MTATAIVSLILSITILWGGLAASAIFLSRKPEVDTYPEDPDGITASANNA